MAMILVIFLLLFSNSHALFLPSNSSILHSVLNPDPPTLSSPTLKEVLKAIAVKERWDPSGEVRVSELDPISVRFGISQRYEFHVRMGRMVLMLKFSDGIVSWRKPWRDWGGFGPDIDFGSGFDEDPKPAVRGLELEGPLDLRVAGWDEEEISLLLPAVSGDFSSFI